MLENLFEYYLENDKFHLKYAKGDPAVKEQEFHDYNEFVFFIEGESYLISKNIQQDLAPGSIILIPKENFHQFCVSHPKTYVRCILGFRESEELSRLTKEVMDTIKVISEPDEKIVGIFNSLAESIKSDLTDDEKELHINSALVQLLVHLKLHPSAEFSSNLNISPMVSRALAIIDENYAENLSVESIAKTLYVSPSTLAHKFSRELKISVYKYITKKRLSVAHKLILQGETMANASANSGFGNYSCFYRHYKKYYKQ